jgi:hypothetical protein
MSVNMIYSLLITIEGFIIIALVVKLLFAKNRTKENFKRSLAHIAGIVSIFIVVGHLVSIMALHVIHHETIEIFRKHRVEIPEADRINGNWILEEKKFNITESERKVLTDNYEKSIPCLYENGYCYFELGGFLKNSGGYYYNLNSGPPDLGTLGFHRINQVIELVGRWGFYN